MKPAISDVARLHVDMPCFSCGEEGWLQMSLDGASQLHCNNCDADFDAADIREHIAAWQAVLAFSEALGRDHSRLRDRAQRN